MALERPLAGLLAIAVAIGLLGCTGSVSPPPKSAPSAECVVQPASSTPDPVATSPPHTVPPATLERSVGLLSVDGRDHPGHLVELQGVTSRWSPPPGPTTALAVHVPAGASLAVSVAERTPVGNWSIWYSGQEPDAAVIDYLTVQSSYEGPFEEAIPFEAPPVGTWRIEAQLMWQDAGLWQGIYRWCVEVAE